MRVIAGTLSGRTFNAPSGHRTHPMSEKIRGALFNALGDIEGLSVLDMYSGSGAVSIEAASRGAASVQAVESDQTAARTIQENIQTLNVAETVNCTRAYALAWSRRNQNRRYDIVIMDPPFDAAEPKELLVLSRHCKPGGTLVLSLPPDTGFRFAQSKQQLLGVKNYGDAELFFYRQL